MINNFLVHILRMSFECGRHLLTSYSFAAATHHWVKAEEGQGSWQSPLVPGKGRYKSALGRMGKSKGDDNETYGEEPYYLKVVKEI
jgi:hypothetical protein